VAGWLKAKAKGTKQLFQVVTGTFPKPIPPPDHADLPSVSDTCLKCHSLESITKNGGPVKLILRPRYRDDAKNTREMVAVVLRPAGLTSEAAAAVGADPSVRGVHWHVQADVTYSTSDPKAQTIDVVQVKETDGTTKQFVAASVIGMSSNVVPDVQRVIASGTVRTMDCVDCHNRAGHGIPSVGAAVDDAIAAGRISASLPYIKRDAAAVLSADYPSQEAADAAIEALGATLKGTASSAGSSAQIAAAVDELKRIYRELATPAMKVQAATYPDNLGHETSAGCFRCHDGAHVRVVDGKATSETIPSSCATCHTFPQVGGSITGLLLGGEPASHQDRLYVFSHKDAAAAVASLRTTTAGSTTSQPQTTCLSCHERSYCDNCHQTGAITVSHDEMLYNHVASIRKSGSAACAYCHQPVYCATCHADPVLQAPRLGTSAAVKP
jgi:hypothetical protein